MKKFLITIFIFSLIFTCAKSKKIDFGRIIIYFGDVKIEREGKILKPIIKMVLNEKDKIKTGSNSRVDIQIGNIGIMRINEKTEVEMKSIFKAVNERLDFSIKNGEVLCKLEKLTKNQEVRFYTPTAVVGVRGTSFIINTTKNKTEVGVAEGKVEVSSSSEPEKKTIVKENQTAEVSAESKLPKVIQGLKLEKLEKIKAIENFKVIEDIEKIVPQDIKKYLPLEMLKTESRGGTNEGIQSKIEVIKEKKEEVEENLKEKKEEAEKKLEEVKAKAEEAKAKIEEKSEKAKEKVKETEKSLKEIFKK